MYLISENGFMAKLLKSSIAYQSLGEGLLSFDEGELAFRREHECVGVISVDIATNFLQERGNCYFEKHITHCIRAMILYQEVKPIPKKLCHWPG